MTSTTWRLILLPLFFWEKEVAKKGRKERNPYDQTVFQMIVMYFFHFWLRCFYVPVREDVGVGEKSCVKNDMQSTNCSSFFSFFFGEIGKVLPPNLWVKNTNVLWCKKKKRIDFFFTFLSFFSTQIECWNLSEIIYWRLSSYWKDLKMRFNSCYTICLVLLDDVFDATHFSWWRSKLLKEQDLNWILTNDTSQILSVHLDGLNMLIKFLKCYTQ